MSIEYIREYCLSLKGATEETPFGPQVLVFKVMGKIFALLPLDSSPTSISLKNLPENNIELRERYSSIVGAYHMSKVHWNTITLNFQITPVFIKEQIDISYGLVKQSLNKKLKVELEAL
jgi:predicted DNA-binding protein (MmcQ/YjbR family)